MNDFAPPDIAAAGLYIGLNLLILLFAGINVSRYRRATQTSLGEGEGKLQQACRAYGNSAEWLPGALLGLAVAAHLGAPALAIHVLGLMLTLGRVMFIAGLLSNPGPSVGRIGGMALTYLVYLGLGAGLVAHALI
ncbi:MAG: MAPEG family protein [Oceanicaulis sp.]